MEMGRMGNIFDILEACNTMIAKSWIKKYGRDATKTISQSKARSATSKHRGKEIVRLCRK